MAGQRLWLYNGEGDFGKIDNVEAKGTLIRVPAAAWLFGSGIGLLAWLRRKPG